MSTLTELSVNLVDHNDPGIEENLSKWVSGPNKIQSLKITAFLTRTFTKTLMESIRKCYQFELFFEWPVTATSMATLGSVIPRQMSV